MGRTVLRPEPDNKEAVPGTKTARPFLRVYPVPQRPVVCEDENAVLSDMLLNNPGNDVIRDGGVVVRLLTANFSDPLCDGLLGPSQRVSYGL